MNWCVRTCVCYLRRLERFVPYCTTLLLEKERTVFAPWPWDGFRKLSQAQANSPQVPSSDPLFFFRSLFLSHSGRQMTSRGVSRHRAYNPWLQHLSSYLTRLFPKTRPRGPRDRVHQSPRSAAPTPILISHTPFFFFHCEYGIARAGPRFRRALSELHNSLALLGGILLCSDARPLHHAWGSHHVRTLSRIKATLVSVLCPSVERSRPSSSALQFPFSPA